jgi:hypothetical protein
MKANRLHRQPGLICFGAPRSRRKSGTFKAQRSARFPAHSRHLHSSCNQPFELFPIPVENAAIATTICWTAQRSKSYHYDDNDDL